MVFKNNAGRFLVVEVVHTHAPELETLRRYQAAKVPVAIVKIESWHDVKKLHQEVCAYDFKDPIRPVLCDDCKAKDEADRDAYRIWDEIAKSKERSDPNSSIPVAMLDDEDRWLRR